MKGAIGRELATLLPREALLSEADLASWPPGVPVPAAAVAPATEDEVAAVLEKASMEGWRVLPAGLGSWLDGGGGMEADLVLSTRRLGEMAGYEPADLTFTAGAGMPWRVLQDATRRNGQWLPLDPPGVGKGSLGAVAALGVAGPLRHTYGAPRDHVLGLTLISGDGRILRWGGRVVKNVAGYDVTRLSIGSWGALGVLTSVSARLFPYPELERTLIVRGPSAEALMPAARAMAQAPIPFSAVELLEPWDLSRAHGAGTVSGKEGHYAEGSGGGGSWEKGGSALILRIQGSEAQVLAVEEEARKVLSADRGRMAESMLVFTGEKSCVLHEGLQGWEDGAQLVLRLALLPSQLGILVEEARALGEILPGKGSPAPSGVSFEGASRNPRSLPGEGSTEIRLAAHVGWGVLRVALEVVPEGRELRQRLTDSLVALRHRLEGEGGSLTLSKAPRELLQDVGAWGSFGDGATLMKGLRREFDPAGILVPGRFGLP